MADEQNDLDDAELLYREFLSIMQALGIKPGIDLGQNRLASIAKRRGSPDEAAQQS